MYIQINKQKQIGADKSIADFKTPAEMANNKEVRMLIILYLLPCDNVISYAFHQAKARGHTQTLSQHE